MKIYFGGAIRGGRGDTPTYQEFIAFLKQFGEVLTEHVGSERLSSQGEKLTDQEIHDRDMKWIEKADVLIAEVSTPSLGVGYEVGRAIEMGKKILCLHRSREGEKLSGMINGCAHITTKKYQDLEEAKQIMKDFLS